MSLLAGCDAPSATSEPPSPTTSAASLLPAADTPAPPVPTDTPLPQGNTITVSSAADIGPGTLRQALADAQPYDTITFEPAVFPPDNPTVIAVARELPWLAQGHITIDASNAGVILDGSGSGGGPGLTIESEGNTVQGLQIVHFSGAGIMMWEHAFYNVIGGDPQIGSGPLGQGNLLSGNSDGIGLDRAGHNTIAGNLIGVELDGTTPKGNPGAGIYIMGAALENVIGPDNVIAFSGDPGIDIRSVEAVGITITQNRIHDNAAAVRMIPHEPSPPLRPVILAFDLGAGMVGGVACPNCVVEVFSGEGAGAHVYEGSVTADQQGAFELEIPNPLTGPSLKATATGADGSTSIFSLPTTGSRGYITLQEGNDQFANPIYALNSEDLAQNRIGTHRTFDDGYYTQPFYEMAGLGLKNVRLTFNEMEMPVDLNRPDFSIGQAEDDLVDAMLGQGMELTYILTFWDKAYQAEGGDLPCSRFTTEDEFERYLDYVQTVVSHFRGRIDYFEIWNEPDAGACTQHIEPKDYVNLVSKVVPVIWQENPEAKVVVGSTTGLHDPGSQAYLMAIVDSEIMPLVNVVAWHPFYGASPAYPDVAEYYYTYPALVQEIKKRASGAGFEGEFRADELTWRVPAFSNPDHPWNHEEVIAAKYYTRSIVMHLGMDVDAFVDVDSRLTNVYSTVRNMATIMEGTTPTSLDVEIHSDATNIMSYGFSGPNGETMVALWTDGIAVESDPGIAADLIFPGFGDSGVTGLDALHGFEQELITETNNGDLVIPELLVRDYPIILRLTN